MIFHRAVALFTVVVLSTFSISATSEERDPQIKNITTDGNLKSNYEVGCVPISSVKNVYTPADLYKGLAECINSGDFKSGASLNALAGVYGRYDTLRVADKTAHQATLVLRMQTFETIPQETMDLFVKEIQAKYTDKKKLGEICNQIRLLGPPNYVPSYMIQHGISAARNPSGQSGIVADFDPKSSWESALSTYLHCEGAASES